MYEDATAIVELDGRRFRVRHAALTEDARRDRLAREHGYDTVRFTHLQLRNDPDHVVEVSRTLSART
jgi:very-short-patch-repair endonuclease